PREEGSPEGGSVQTHLGAKHRPDIRVVGEDEEETITPHRHPGEGAVGDRPAVIVEQCGAHLLDIVRGVTHVDQEQGSVLTVEPLVVEVAAPTVGRSERSVLAEDLVKHEPEAQLPPYRGGDESVAGDGDLDRLHRNRKVTS